MMFTNMLGAKYGFGPSVDFVAQSLDLSFAQVYSHSDFAEVSSALHEHAQRQPCLCDSSEKPCTMWLLYTQ